MAGVVVTATDNKVVAALTAEQQALVTATQKNLDDLNNNQIPAANQEDATNDKLFHKFDDFIVAYETDMKWINGVYQTNPVTDNDLIQIQEGRLWANGAIELIRIPELDGNGTTSTLSDYYLARLSALPAFLNYLQTGLTTSVGYSGSTTGSITPSSTFLVTTSNSTALAGKEFLVYGSGTSFIGLASTVTDNSVGPGSQTSGSLITGVSYTISNYMIGDDFTNVGAATNMTGTVFTATGTTPTNYTNGSTLTTSGATATQWTVSFTFVSTFTGSIGGGATITGSWGGFSNSERTAKVASNSALQTVMNYYVNQINANIIASLVFLGNEITANTGNYDPNLGTPNVAINAEISYYNNYLIATDISDTGLSGLNTATTNHTTRANNTLTSDNKKKSAYYDKRFFWANQRSGSGGSITAIWRLGLAVTAAESTLATAQLTLAQLQKGMT